MIKVAILVLLMIKPMLWKEIDILKNCIRRNVRSLIRRNRRKDKKVNSQSKNHKSEEGNLLVFMRTDNFFKNMFLKPLFFAGIIIFEANLLLYIPIYKYKKNVKKLKIQKTSRLHPQPLLKPLQQLLKVQPK